MMLTEDCQYVKGPNVPTITLDEIVAFLGPQIRVVGLGAYLKCSQRILLLNP